jgi:methionyl-tRNA formyltransferase
MAIVFIGTPDFAVPSLERLAADGHPIAAVITQPDRPAGRGRRPNPPPVRTAAERLGLAVWQPADLRDAEALERLASLEPEVIVAVAYGRILRRKVLNIPPRGVLNVHPSLLPRWRGPSPVQATILAGDEETGVTIMLMDEGMDSGPVLAQQTHAVSPHDTAGSLMDTLAGMGADLLAGTLPRWLSGEIDPVQQDESLATVSSLIRKEDGLIDWNLPAVDIWRRVRAYNPWPGAYTTFEGDLLHIWRAWPVASGGTAEPGTVIGLSADDLGEVPREAGAAGFAVQAGDGLLAVTEVQRAGRRRLPAADFLRGAPGLAGAALPS